MLRIEEQVQVEVNNKEKEHTSHITLKK